MHKSRKKLILDENFPEQFGTNYTEYSLIWIVRYKKQTLWMWSKNSPIYPVISIFRIEYTNIQKAENVDACYKGWYISGLGNTVARHQLILP